MNIISSCQMGPGTFEAKFIPLSEIDSIDNIYVLRKQTGPEINKVTYILPPSWCKSKWICMFVLPILLTYHTIKTKSRLILGYHVVPHAIYAFIASRLTGVPFSISQTGLMVQHLSEKPVIGRMLLYIFRKAKYINVPGSASGEHWARKGIDRSKIFLLHSTISTEVYRNLEFIPDYDCVFLGRLAPEKNIELILQAFVALRSEGIILSLVIVGDGPERDKLNQIVIENKLSNQVTFVGFQKDVTQWLNKATVFLMSSTSDAMPTALMQAMACERICISSEVGNIGDLLVHDQNGFLFKSQDLSELIGLIKYAFKNKTQLELIRKNARMAVIKNHSHHSAKFKWEAHIEKLNKKL